jgi:hypothetical protein
MRAKAERRIRLAKILPQDVSRYSQGNRLSGVPSRSQKSSRDPISTPISWILFACCASDAKGRAVAVPRARLMNSRLLIGFPASQVSVVEPNRVQYRGPLNLSWLSSRFCRHPPPSGSTLYAVDCDLIVCYGGAKLTHKHLASKIHCVDDEIIAPVWIETSLRDLMENLCALNGRSLPRQSQFI